MPVFSPRGSALSILNTSQNSRSCGACIAFDHSPHHSIFALRCCFFSAVFFLLSILFSLAILFLHTPHNYLLNWPESSYTPCTRTVHFCPLARDARHAPVPSLESCAHDLSRVCEIVLAAHTMPLHDAVAATGCCGSTEYVQLFESRPAIAWSGDSTSMH